MRSDSMDTARNFLVGKWGESYGQTKWAWLLQKYGLMPWDEVPEAMGKELNN